MPATVVVADSGGGSAMRIGARIGIGFAAVVLVTGVLGAAGWLGLERYARSVANADRMVAVADLARSAGSDIDAYQARRNSDRIGEAQAKLTRSDEHPSELQSLLPNSCAV